LTQKKIIKSVTKKFVTEIIQESTDAIYRFEDDSISLADHMLRQVLQREIRNLIKEVVKEFQMRHENQRQRQLTYARSKGYYAQQEEDDFAVNCDESNNSQFDTRRDDDMQQMIN